nr:hypothetical protein [Candidatus Mycoplasma haematolamae]
MNRHLLISNNHSFNGSGGGTKALEEVPQTTPTGTPTAKEPKPLPERANQVFLESI